MDYSIDDVVRIARAYKNCFDEDIEFSVEMANMDSSPKEKRDAAILMMSVIEKYKKVVPKEIRDKLKWTDFDALEGKCKEII